MDKKFRLNIKFASLFGFLILGILVSSLYFNQQIHGTTSISDVSLNVSATALSATANYTVTFTSPENLPIGTGINLFANANGPYNVAPDFTNATIGSALGESNVLVSIYPPQEGQPTEPSMVNMGLGLSVNAGDTVRIVLKGVVNPSLAAQYRLNVSLNPASEEGQPPSQDNSISGSTNFLLGYDVINTISGKVSLSTTGAGITDGQINANQRGGQLFLNTNTNASGNYTLQVPPGEWEIRVGPQYGQNGPLAVNWAYTGSGSVTNTTDGDKTVNLSVVPATATVKGKVLKPDGTPMTMGGIDIRTKEGVGINNGTNQSGEFSIQVPSGSYRISIFSQESEFTSPEIDSFSVGENETKDLGTITLVKKTSRLQGKVIDKDSNVGIGQVRINAWAPEGSGWGETTTNSNGEFELLVGVGTWELMPQPSPDLGYTFESGPPTRVAVAANETKSGFTFKLIRANSIILGQVIDINGNQINDFFGHAEAMEGSGDQPKPGPGGQIEGGQFLIRVPAGTWTVNAMTQPGSEYSSTGAKTVTVADGASASVQITVKQNDAWISGTVKDEDGSTVTGIRAEVFAENGKGSFKMAQLEENGTYRMGVIGGDSWYLGVFVDPTSGYMMIPPTDSKESVAKGETKTRNFNLLKANASIKGQVVDPDGNGLSNVFVFVDTNLVEDGMVLGANTGLPDNAGGPIDKGAQGKGIQSGNLTDSDGEFNLQIPAGTYGIGSGAPSSLGFINPEFQKVTVAKNETKDNITLRYRKADATISGSITLNGNKTEAFVWAWSDKGAHSESDSRSGDYTLNVSKGDVWHIGADYEDGNQKFYRSSEFIVDLTSSSSATQNLVLTESSFTLPPSVSQTIDASAGGTIQLENQFTLTIPAGAFASSGNYTVTITPNAQLTKEKNNRPLAFGYSISAVDSTGQELSSNFNSNVRIVIPYTDAMLAELGISEDDLSASFFDTTSSIWQGVDSFTVNKEDNTIIGSISHFTEFAITTGAADTTPPANPTSPVATAGSLLVTLSWTNPSDTDFDHMDIYRSTTSGTLGSRVTSTSSNTVTSYEDTGLTAGTTYYYTLRAIDVTGNASTGTSQVSAVAGAQTQLPATGTSIIDALVFYAHSLMKNIPFLR